MKILLSVFLDNESLLYYFHASEKMMMVKLE